MEVRHNQKQQNPYIWTKWDFIFPPPAPPHQTLLKIHENLHPYSRKDIIKTPKRHYTSIKVPTYHPLLSAPLHETTPVKDIPLPTENTSIIIHNLAGHKLAGLM